MRQAKYAQGPVTGPVKLLARTLIIVEDQLVLTLPDVPLDCDSDHTETFNSFEDDVDENIRQRLTKLQFFSKVWAHGSPLISSVEHLSLKLGIESVNDGSEFDATDIVPVVGTEEERQHFNDWYYARIGKSNEVENYQIHNSPVSTDQSGTKVSSSLSPANNPVLTHLSKSSLRNGTENNKVFNTINRSHSVEDTKQEDLLDFIFTLCYMEVNVVTMVITATLILDKLNKVMAGFDSNPDCVVNNTTDSAPRVTMPGSPQELEPDQAVQQTVAPSQRSASVLPLCNFLLESYAMGKKEANNHQYISMS